MQMLRNKEMKKFVITYLFFSLMAAGGIAFYNIYSGVYVLIVCILSGFIFFIYTKKRYKEIARLSFELNEILHGKSIKEFVPDEEGEIALLSSEIYKMTIRLQEQTNLLLKEKIYLRDSLADISHQIRTPLTSIRMIVPRLGREDLSITQRQEYIQETTRLFTRLEWLIGTLLKIAQLESGTVDFEKEKVNVRKLLDAVLEPLEIILELKEINIEVNCDESITYMGDFMWSCEAIGNVVKNCIEHLKEGSNIIIDVSDNNIYTNIDIKDNGRGILPEDLPHIFERFYKGKNSSMEHAGIGLSLSQIIIARQDGVIKAGNLEPHGAEFIIKMYKGAL